jgi:polyhydroxyalkanoate synthase
MQLIQYEPTTKKVFQYPLLLVAPFINKYYVFDLQKDNSLVKWLVDKGFRVFVTSWVNPTSEHRDKQFSDYFFEGVLEAVQLIKQMTEVDRLNVVGYCISGTLLGCILAYLAKKNDSSVNSATFFTTLFDFSDSGQLGSFIDEKYIVSLENVIQKTGYLDGSLLKSLFNGLRARNLIWSPFITQYLNGERQKPFDLFAWASDPVNVSEKVISFYLRNGYLNNLFIKPNQVEFGDESLDFSKITTPSYFLAAQDDHIVPWNACYISQKILKGPVRFVLTKSGHVAGVINHPKRKKYSFLASNKKFKNSKEYLENALNREGSWWNDWHKWLKKFSGNLIPLDYSNFYPAITYGDAPGSYILKR